MERKIIEKMINLWDPFGLFEAAPEGEYKDLVDEVEKLLLNTKKDKKILLTKLEAFLSKQFEDVEYSEIKLKEFIDLLLRTD